MKIKVTIDGKTYEVDVEAAEPEQPRPSYIPPLESVRAPSIQVPSNTEPPPSGAKNVADEGKVCRSPMAGIVVRISAQVGQEIQVNDVLLVLEAMKMETVVTSPSKGKVSQVNVKVGDSVQGGQVVVELE